MPIPQNVFVVEDRPRLLLSRWIRAIPWWVHAAIGLWFAVGLVRALYNAAWVAVMAGLLLVAVSVLNTRGALRRRRTAR